MEKRVAHQMRPVERLSRIVVYELGVIREHTGEERLKYEIELCKKKIKQNEAMLKNMKKKKVNRCVSKTSP